MKVPNLNITESIRTEKNLQLLNLLERVLRLHLCKSESTKFEINFTNKNLLSSKFTNVSATETIENTICIFNDIFHGCIAVNSGDRDNFDTF